MSTIRFQVPRLVIAGLAGDSGKTLVSLGLARVCAARGLDVRPFKKGPDYIDAAWLAEAAGSRCRNLDTFLMSDGALAEAVATASNGDLVLVEGNRGLFDGVDAHGSHSTAALARRLGAPVLLVVDVTKSTRTVAALVLGCRQLEPGLEIAGVILNRVGTARQEAVIREAVEQYAGVPVLGAIRRIAGEDPLPGRHLGLVTAVEHPRREQAVVSAARAVKEQVDVDRVLAAARRAPEIELEPVGRERRAGDLRIGVFTDPAFSFYYPENLEGLEAAGASLVAVHPGEGRHLPTLDGLYLGGGFPEVHAARLADCTEFLADLRTEVADGLPVYAECGGLMYLARELRVGGSSFPMAGVLDLVVEQQARPQGHGYEVGTVDRDNPFHPAGTTLRGHEFHHSRVVAGDDGSRTVVGLDRGTGVAGSRDGIVRDRVWASYLHLHGLATPGWCEGFLGLARQRSGERAPAAWA